MSFLGKLALNTAKFLYILKINYKLGFASLTNETFMKQTRWHEVKDHVHMVERSI